MNSGDRKAAIVVGGGTGIGYAVATRLVARGFALLLVGRRGEVLTDACEGLGGFDAFVTTFEADCGVESEAQSAVDAATRAFGRLDACVNCAGTYEAVDFLELDAGRWARSMSASLDSMLFVGRAAARVMAAGDGGRIVLVSSVASVFGEPLSAAYCVAKAGVNSLGRSMATDLARHGITVNVVAPGWVDTEMVAEFVAGLSPQAWERFNMVGRIGTPDEVAHVIEYLAADAPAFLTGSTIFVDGGQSAFAAPPG